jgi:hypothetical protein
VTTIVIERRPDFPSGKLFLPMHPVCGCLTIVDGRGETVDAAHVLVDRDLGIVRSVCNAPLDRYPYTVTIT